MSVEKKLDALIDALGYDLTEDRATEEAYMKEYSKVTKKRMDWNERNRNSDTYEEWDSTISYPKREDYVNYVLVKRDEL